MLLSAPNNVVRPCLVPTRAMQDRIVAAAIQMSSTESVAENLATAERLIGQAAAQGAQLVVLPELFACYGRGEAIVASGEALSGPIARRLASWAERWGIVLCGGSIAETSRRADKVFNTCLLFDEQGRQRARYRKLHLFDADLDGPHAGGIRESRHLVAGEAPVAAEALGAKLGLAICYDLRFPELFRAPALAGLDLLLLPAAFTRTTGRAHWEILLRARAIENQCFVIAANQAGEHAGGLTSFGHSLIVSPWGDVLATLGDEREGVALATLEAATLADVRGRLPALHHRRL